MTNHELRVATNFYRSAFTRFHYKESQSDNFKNIVLARNPYSRVASAFVDKFCGEDREEPWVREVIESHGKNGEITFNQFLLYLLDTPEEKHDPHWRRQTYILDGVRVDNIIKIESLKEDSYNLSYILGSKNLRLLMMPRQTNRYDESSVWDEVDLPNVSQKKLVEISEKVGFFPRHSEFLNDDNRKVISDIYGKDFDFLGYDI